MSHFPEEPEFFHAIFLRRKHCSSVRVQRGVPPATLSAWGMKDMYAADTPDRSLAVPPVPPQVREKIRRYIQESILLGCDAELADGASLIDAGIIDSTGAIELVAFLESEFAIAIADEELTPDNLDSVDRICRLVESKLASVS